MAAAPPSESDTLLADLELTRALAIQMTCLGTLGLIVAASALGGLYEAVTGASATFQFGPAGAAWWTSALDVLVILVLATVILVPHEWLHGLAIRYYGGEPRYGVGVAHFILPYAYATTDHEFTRNQFVVVLLTPLVVMTAVGVPLMLAFEWGWLVVPLAANAGGAVADLWMTLTLLGVPADAEIRDHPKGVRIYGRASDRRRRVSVTALVWDALSGAAVAAVAVFVLLAVIGPFALDFLGVDSLAIGSEGTFTYLFSFASTPTEISLVVGPGVLTVGAAVGLIYALVRSYRRSRAVRPSAESDSGAGR